MHEHDFYDDLDAEDMDGIDDEDLWDLEGEADLLTPAGLALGTVAAGVGAAGGGNIATAFNDATTWAAMKALDATGLSQYKPVKWFSDYVLDPTSYVGSTKRNMMSNMGAAVGGTLLGAPVMAALEDADPFEPEFSSEDIDRMEALAEEAAEAEGEDAILAADEMVSRSFGVMRASPQMRPIIAALRNQVRRIVVMAKRNPQHRAQARVAPLALRRTTAILMQLTATRRPVDIRTALMIFGRTMSELMQSPQGRAQAVLQAQSRARRHRARHGLPAPARVQHPIKAARQAAIQSERAQRRAMQNRYE